MAQKGTSSGVTRRSERISAGVRRPSPEQIAARAYEIFLDRGAEHGFDVDDWLRAEKELGKQN